jgi:predicted RNA-binding protein with PIN domain
MAAQRVWIMDGHNMIFAIAGLESLQRSSRGGEARALLAERLEAFAHRTGERVLVVFDGNDLPSNLDAVSTPLFETVYARRGDQAADRRIVSESTRLAGRGVLVTVVTNDVNTLAIALPRAVRRLGVREFWLRHIERPQQADEKRVEGNFADIERALLDLAASEPVPAHRRGAPTIPASAAPGAAFRAETPAETPADRLRRKRDRGRLRQERLLRQRSKK